MEDLYYHLIENLYAATGGSPPRAATDGWYSEVKDYDRNNPQYSHFTQMVWRATTELGCAVANCPPGSIFPAEVSGTHDLSNQTTCIDCLDDSTELLSSMFASITLMGTLAGSLGTCFLPSNCCLTLGS